MKSLFSLDLLEVQLPESTVIAGERYLHEGRVDHLREIDKNLWQARVTGSDKVFEPEVLLRGNYLKAFTCDCSLGLKKFPCNHITAMLFLLRRLRDQRRQKLSAQKQFLPEIQLKRLLLLVPQDDLLQFIRDWAQFDSEFDLSIKARFFHILGHAHHSAHLEQLFTPFVLEDGSLTIEPDQALKPLRLFLKHLLAQTRQLLSSNLEVQAFLNLDYLMQKLTITPPFRYRAALIKQIIQIIEQDAAPANLDPNSPRFQFLINALSLFIRMNEDQALQMTLISLQAYLGFEEARKNMNQELGNLLRKGVNKSINSQSLILVYYQSLDQKLKDGPWLEHLNLPRLSPVVYERLCQTLLDTGDFEGTDRLIKEGLDWYPHYVELLRIQSALYWEMHRTQALPKLLRQLIKTSLNTADLKTAKGYLSNRKWSAFLISLQGELNVLPATYERNVLLCEISCETNSFDELEKILIQSGSPKLLLRFLPRLPDKHNNQVIQIVTGFLVLYLDHHMGPKATAVVHSLLDALSEPRLQPAKKEIRKFLLQRYPERPQLTATVLSTNSILQNEN